MSVSVCVQLLGKDPSPHWIMPTMTPKRPKALPKIYTTRIFTKESESWASAMAHPDPETPTQTLNHQRRTQVQCRHQSPRKSTHTDLLVSRLILALRLPLQNLLTDGEQKEPWQACAHSWPATGGSFVDGPRVLDVVDVRPGAPNATRTIPVLEY